MSLHFESFSRLPGKSTLRVFHPQQPWLIRACDSVVTVEDVAHPRRLAEWSVPGIITAIAVNDHFVAVAAATVTLHALGTSGTLLVSDPQEWVTRTPVTALTLTATNPPTVLWAPRDQRDVWVGGSDPKNPRGTVRLEGRRAVVTLRLHPQRSLLAVIHRDGLVRLYDPLALKAVHQLDSRGPLTAVTFHPQLNYLVGARGGAVEVWGEVRNEPIAPLQFLAQRQLSPVAIGALHFHPWLAVFFAVTVTGDVTSWTIDQQMEPMIQPAGLTAPFNVFQAEQTFHEKNFPEYARPETFGERKITEMHFHPRYNFIAFGFDSPHGHEQLVFSLVDVEVPPSVYPLVSPITIPASALNEGIDIVYPNLHYVHQNQLFAQSLLLPEVMALCTLPEPV